MTLREDAAAARREQTRTATDRPRQRRSAEHAGSRAYSRARLADVQLRDVSGDNGDRLQFEGLASATEAPYEMFDMFGSYNEVISRGAFGQTLAQPELDVPLVLGHDQLRRIASTSNGTLTLTETDAGLVPRAELDPADADVAYIAPKLRAGLITEMSFGFRIDSGVWSPDYTEYRIERVDLQRGDVSIVGYGANPATSATLRSAGIRLDQVDLDELRAELERRQPAAPSGMSFAALLSLTD